jgi:hypothetical protein
MPPIGKCDFIVVITWMVPPPPTHTHTFGWWQGERMDYTDPPAMAPSVTIAHEINESSPLYNKTVQVGWLRALVCLCSSQWPRLVLFLATVCLCSST